jgi:prepilin-type N-terminal cleavage/methylation domain-containing protein
MKGRSLSAFSLTELLAVIAVIAILAVSARPAFNAIAASRGAGQAAYDMAGLLELARSEAVTRQTYVWVGFQTVTNGGNAELLAGAVASLDGTGTNTAAANLRGLTRVLRVRSTTLGGWNDLKPATQALFTQATPASVATNSGGPAFSIGGAAFTGRTLLFTPRGEALLTGAPGLYDGYTPFIGVGLRQTRGTTVPPDAEDAAVLVDGSTGTVRILRL